VTKQQVLVRQNQHFDSSKLSLADHLASSPLCFSARKRALVAQCFEPRDNRIANQLQPLRKEPLMPIAYSCPHCGKQYSVAEQYAGQTGPCANCGQSITIPGTPPDAYAPLPPQGATSSGAGIGLLFVVLGGAAMLCICGGVLVALLLPAVQAAREAARRSQSQNNLRVLALALHSYHDTYDTLPPAVVTDANGKPLYSGRVLLLPFMEQQALYDAFDLTKAWDSPENSEISQTSIKTFIDPSSPNPAPGKTDYLFVTGKGTVFEDDKAVDFQSITDGLSNTIVLIEAKNQNASWAEPKDIDFSQPMALPPGNHPGGNIAAFGDGSVQFIGSTRSPEGVRKLATRAANDGT
jgi:hypothetical protein